MVKEYIKSKAKMDFNGENSSNSVGKEKIMDLLISNGANVNQADKTGKTPLHRAAELGTKFLSLQHFPENSMKKMMKLKKIQNFQSGMSSVTDLLIKKGADVNKPDLEGESPLHLAARAGIPHIPTQIYPNKMKMNILILKTFNNPTGKEEITKMLIMNGADAFAKDRLGETASQIAIKSGKV